MDKTIRRNEICVIGLPRCDFVFSSTRACFIAYGFEESSLEKSILRGLLEAIGIQPVEAEGELAPGQNAFCAKICSKIINSQFCIILLNNEEEDGREIPNANVNMEYGLMLGFNKYVIPFQRESQRLPFNVAGLDTIKYSDRDFERKAKDAINQANKATRQDEVPSISIDQVLEVFLLTKKALVTPLNTEGDRNLYQLGDPLGFNLLNNFSGLSYIYFGKFTTLRPEAVLWRLRMLKEILDERRSTLPTRFQVGIATAPQIRLLDEILGNLQIWVVVTSEVEKRAINEALREIPLGYETQIFSIEDIGSQLAQLMPPSSEKEQQ